MSSPDSDWDRATVFSVRFSDPHMRQARQYRGHAVIMLPSGDQLFHQYEFTFESPPSPGGDARWQVTGRFVRGTGKFRGVTGTFRERGTSSMLADTSEGWEVEYQIR